MKARDLSQRGPTPSSREDVRTLPHRIDPNALELDAYPWPLDVADRIIAAGWRPSEVTVRPEPILNELTESARAPGWFGACCRWCDWETTGREPVVEDAWHEHAKRVHPRRYTR